MIWLFACSLSLASVGDFQNLEKSVAQVLAQSFATEGDIVAYGSLAVEADSKIVKPKLIKAINRSISLL